MRLAPSFLSSVLLPNVSPQAEAPTGADSLQGIVLHLVFR